MQIKGSWITHRIHGAAIYGNMDPINIPQMLAYIYTPYMDPIGKYTVVDVLKELSLEHNDSRISDFDNSGSWATSDSSGDTVSIPFSSM